MKNWPSLAWWLIDMCIVNAYRLFTLQTHSTASQLEFRIALMEQLARAYPPQRTFYFRTCKPRRLHRLHVISMIEQDNPYTHSSRSQRTHHHPLRCLPDVAPKLYLRSPTPHPVYPYSWPAVTPQSKAVAAVCCTVERRQLAMGTTMARPLVDPAAPHRRVC